MSEALGARLAVGPALPQQGWLRAHAPGAGDVAFVPGGTLPLPDRSVEMIACSCHLSALSRARLLALLLECRRVLAPGGALWLAASRGQDATHDGLPRLAAMAGLAGYDDAFDERGAALSAWLDAQSCVAAHRYTKPDRRLRGQPLVTIAIPAYGARFFEAALASALAQAYPALEILVCDDSRDDAIERIARRLSTARAVRYVRNEATLGVRANYRRCLESAQGTFVKFLCDDDLLAPGCVAALVDAFRRAPDIALATSHRRRIDERGAALTDDAATTAPVRRSAVIAGVSLANVMVMAGVNLVGEPSTALFRKTDLLDAAPRYFAFDDAEGHGIIDMVTWAALLLKGDAVYLHESLSYFRIHPGQRQRDPAKRERNSASVHELQRAWGALELHTRVRPEQLLVKPYPPAPRDPWRLALVRSPAARLVLPTIAQP